MKISIGLLLLSLSLAFVAGYASLQLRQRDGPQFAFNTENINALKREFRETHSISDEVNAAELFPTRAGFELLDPRNVFHASRNRTFSETAAILRAIKSCKPGLLKNNDFSKARVWISFQCGVLSQLPQDFFVEPPFLFPLGISYAELAVASGNEKFKTEKWLKDNIPFFHVLELREITTLVELDSKRKIFSKLEPQVLLAMTAGQPWVANEEFLFIKRTEENVSDLQVSQPTIDYLLYEKKAWDAFLGNRGVRTVLGKAEGCLYREDGLCWDKSVSAAQKKVQWTIGVLFFLALGATAFCAHQIIKIIKNQKHEDERKRFALQTLTHELRTPLASLVLSSERVLDQFESLPSFAKEPFLRMSDDVQRLLRVAESSRHYLSASDRNSVVSFNFSKLASVNEFIFAVLDRYAGEIDIIPLAPDSEFVLDTYWVGVCLQNLVQNACQHGLKPVSVHVKKETKFLVLTVYDSGDIPKIARTKLLNPFFKTSQSGGLGLGLAIVQTVVTSMNSTLKINFNPTSFELRLTEPT